ncbi:hypothetical protein FA95DRAFT_1231842 [Auriscalpium vulgare]|uniref:Uncharacterized protein n=1 Tax=Auriscalpium vulgare TaxID=40419 RepID=A0ACB8RT61_9AGAM|nr:hypothetical protein FA95DRAFT_1231842 [Auriscalpium vulgare]
MSIRHDGEFSREPSRNVLLAWSTRVHTDSPCAEARCHPVRSLWRSPRRRHLNDSLRIHIIPFFLEPSSFVRLGISQDPSILSAMLRICAFGSDALLLRTQRSSPAHRSPGSSGTVPQYPRTRKVTRRLNRCELFWKYADYDSEPALPPSPRPDHGGRRAVKPATSDIDGPAVDDTMYVIRAHPPSHRTPRAPALPHYP